MCDGEFLDSKPQSKREKMGQFRITKNPLVKGIKLVHEKVYETFDFTEIRSVMILHRTKFTKKELFLYGKEGNMLCRYCQMNDSIIHTFQNCSWTKQFFSKVIKWFNAENATSLSFSQRQCLAEK